MYVSTGPYPPGLFPPEDVPELAFDEGYCYHDGLGFISIGTLKSAWDIGKKVVSGAKKVIGGSGGTPRRYGPCCTGSESGTYPRNAGTYGAPPDYRTHGSPMEQYGRNGALNVDNFCDCIPIDFVGGRWVLGEVRGGKVYVGPPTNHDAGMWVKVDEAGNPVLVPGIGKVYPDGGFDPPPPSPRAAAVSPLVGLLLAGAAVGLVMQHGRK